MPAGTPNLDAPEFYWAGAHDAQALADATGASWTAPLWALSEPRVINVADLCAAPAPSAPVFTTTDLVQGLAIWTDTSPIRAKLNNYVDAGLWRTFCTPADDPAPPAVPDNPPPADLPTTDPPEDPTQQILMQIRAWTKFLVQYMNPRGYTAGDSSTVTGNGHVSFTPGEEGEWTTYAVGARFEVLARPDSAGRSNGGDFPVFYDLGWVSLDSESYGQQPVRLQHDLQVETGSYPRVDGVYHNFPPGVEVRISPLYPVVPFGYGGG